MCTHRMYKNASYQLIIKRIRIHCHYFLNDPKYPQLWITIKFYEKTNNMIKIRKIIYFKHLNFLYKDA